ncbi:MAG TPA: DUF4412 domain-containing protein [Methylomirabilota bacterium]|nr:DUF4412 domain-containing protein [Methylomirabilota bacterium]
MASLTRALALASVLLLAPAAHAGWIILDEGGDHTLLSRGRLKVAPKRAEGHSVMLDVSRARMWVADAGRRAYWEGPVEEYCQAVRGTMAAVDKQMAEAMKDLPPAQREQMQQMMKQMGRGGAPGPAPRVTIERTGETQTIAGLPTRKYRVLADGKLYEELWLTTEAALLRELDLERAPDTFGRVFACMVGGGGERVEATNEYRQVYAQGWPLKAVYHGEGGGAARLVVTRVEQRDVPEHEFTPPAGFRPAPLAELLGLSGR